MSVPNIGKSTLIRTSISTTAMVAFAFLALTSFRWIGFALAALTLIALTDRFVRRGPSGYVTDQLLLLSGFLVEFDRQPHSHLAEFLLVGSGILLMAMLLNQATFKRATKGKVSEIAHLPGAHLTSRPLVPPPVLLASWTVLVALVGLSALLKAPAWPVALLTVIIALATVMVLGQAVMDRRRAHAAPAIIRTAVERYAPEFVFYYSAPMGSEYHVHMWTPYLDRLGKRYIIVIREPGQFKNIASAVDAPVIVCKSVAEVDNLIVPSLKACFYANNGMKNAHMVRFNQLTHIQMLHGDSDKASSYNPVTAMFDKIYVAGQAGIDRYAANDVYIDPAKFVIVGRPQVEKIAVARQSIRDIANQTVMYATTWSGLYADTNYSSLAAIGKVIVQDLLNRGATVIFRPHPLTRRSGQLRAVATEIEEMLAADHAKTSRRHIFGERSQNEMSLFECFNLCDALISDVSGVASDFLYSEKPLALTDMISEGADFVENFPLARAAYVLSDDASNLDSVLAELLDIDTLAETRRRMKQYYLGDFPAEAYVDGFLQAAIADVDRIAAPAVTAVPPAPRLPEVVHTNA